VDGTGCGISDYCPAEGSWKNHGAYVSCVARTAESFLDAGIISEAEKDAMVSVAAKSDIGKKEKKEKKEVRSKPSHTLHTSSILS